MNPLILRPLQVGDLEAVVRLFKLSFPEWLQPFMIYGQHGVDRYLGDILNYRGVFPTFEFSVMIAGEELVGFSEFRLAGRQGFLSNIFVAEAARGQGVASRMIRAFTDSHPHVDMVGLDVFLSNDAARRLYCKLGFTDEEDTYWITTSLSNHLVDAPAQLVQPASSVAMHARYGFCELYVQGRVPGPMRRFGRLGETVLRSFDSPEDQLDVPAGLMDMFPMLTTLFSTTRRRPQWAHETLDISRRMTLRVEDGR